MHPALRTTVIGALAAGLLYGTSLVAFAADPAATSMASGTLVGDRGGAYSSWNVTLPANKDVWVSVAHWPCNTGSAIGLDVYGPASKYGQSSSVDACTERATFNTGAGGAATVRVYNYVHGLGTWYTVTADGFTLPGGSAAPAVAAPAAEVKPAAAAADTTAAPAAAAPVAAAPAPAAAAPAPAPAGAAVNKQDQTLLGNSGGASASYDIMAKEGAKYTVKMHYGTDMGGTWPGIGFKVWGPGGWVTSSHSTGHGTAEAWFTATGDVKYTVEVYNYHHGVTAFYGIEATSAATN